MHRVGSSSASAPVSEQEQHGCPLGAANMSQLRHSLSPTRRLRVSRGKEGDAECAHGRARPEDREGDVVALEVHLYAPLSSRWPMWRSSPILTFPGCRLVVQQDGHDVGPGRALPERAAEHNWAYQRHILMRLRIGSVSGYRERLFAANVQNYGLRNISGSWGGEESINM